MVQTLFFDSDKRQKSVLPKFASEIERGDIIWSHLQMGEDRVLEEIIKEIGEDAEFREDLLEEQRPRFNKFKDFQVLVLGVPTSGSLLSEEDGMAIEQVAFIIRNSKLISVSNSPMPLFNNVMRQLSYHRGRLNVSFILSEILDDLTEHIIDIVDDYEDEQNKVERAILNGDADRTLLSNAQTMKENLFYISKILKVNADSIGRLMVVKKKDVISGKFNRNIRNRMLYAVDTVDTVRVALRDLASLHLTVISHKMNENIYRLTILGSFILVPTLIASLYGMNDMPLPFTGSEFAFWYILLGSFVFSFIMFAAIKIKKWI